MSYFTININARSPEELDMRITDNESRGFKLVSKDEVEREANVWVDGGYRNRAGAKYRHAGTDVHKSYKAVTRRANHE